MPCSLSIKPSSFAWQKNYQPVNLAVAGWHKIKNILDHHTDAISSIGILAVTTALLAAKIFPSMPAIIGKSGRLVLEFSGIIWLNVQIKEFSKSVRDCSRALYSSDYETILRTVLKVSIKGVNILLTCAYFSASIATFIGFSQVSGTIYMTLRPLSLAILSTEIINDIWDYATNIKLLKKMDLIEGSPNPSFQIAKLICSYLNINLVNRSQHASTALTSERLASSIFTQLDTFTIKQLQTKKAHTPEDLGRISSKVGTSRIQALCLYYNIKEGLINTQARVKSNLSLIVLGYVSRGICKMYPDSLTEMIVRWGMSVLFTNELIKYKLRQMDLTK
ncbi:MAG: hypothetical protein H0X29_07610 [Parachlamydiaceae bacterium]|nr:hypothetical protein [Parachlamydiaceae bacterium]